MWLKHPSFQIDERSLNADGNDKRQTKHSHRDTKEGRQLIDKTVVNHFAVQRIKHVQVIVVDEVDAVGQSTQR